MSDVDDAPATDPAPSSTAGRYLKGYRRDPQWRRRQHKRLVAATSPPPVTVDLRPFLAGLNPEILTQDFSDCVANAFAGAARLLWKMQGKPAPLVSRRAVYYVARAKDQIQDQDDGCYPSSALSAINEVGVVTETECPYGASPTEPLPADVYRGAFDSKGGLAFRVCGSAADVRRALLLGPVLLAFQVDKGFEDWRPGDAPWTFSGPDLGGHYTYAIGCDATGIRVVSSWGPDFGAGGTLIVSDAEIDSDRCTDRNLLTTVSEPEAT